MIHVVAFRIVLHLLWWTSIGMLLRRTRGYIASLLFAGASALSGIHVGPGQDLSLQLTGVICLAAIGYLVVGHIDRKPIWGIPAAIVSAAAILAKFNIGLLCLGSIVVWATIQAYRDPSRRVLRRLALVAATYAGVLIALFGIYGGRIGAISVISSSIPGSSPRAIRCKCPPTGPPRRWSSPWLSWACRFSPRRSASYGGQTTPRCY